MDLIIDKWNIAGYTLLTLDEYSPAKTLEDYSKIEIDGIKYKPEIVYDMPNTIAIKESDKNFIGKKVNFI